MRKLILAGAVSAVAAFPAITHAATSAGDGSLGGTATVSLADDTDFYTTVGFGSYFFTDMLEGSFRLV
ncbi:MAG: hypothetical protein U5K56_13090 [Halioglobus sp.]|nr:hypothetical protein [Halioglobus sp.]